MKKFLCKFLLFCSPFLVLLIGYVISDPYKVVWRHKDYFNKDNTSACPNDAFRGIRLMNMYKDTYEYDSFIIGSSRSDFYYVDEWKKYIGNNAVCFHFNQSGDNLKGSYDRIMYLYKRFDDVKNLLIVMDSNYLADISSPQGHIFCEPYQTTKEWDFFKFHWEFISAFFNPQNIFGDNFDSIALYPYRYIPQYNELHKDGAEAALNNDPDAYYANLPDSYKLYARNSVETIAEPVIGEKQRQYLEKIAKMAQEHNTNCKIIISPLYNQVKLNPQDLEYLSSLFPGDVFDFSGINQYTSNSSFYYENSHYRPCLCDLLLEYVYLKIQ